MLKKRAFWISFFVSLAVMCPLYLAMLAYVNVAQTRAQAQLAETPQSGVWIAQPLIKDRKTVLVMTGTNGAQSPETFVLVHFDALENRINALSLPGCTVVRSANGVQTLAQAVAEAGPSQGVAVLADTLGVAVDDYLFTTPSALWQAMESFGTIPLKLSQYVPQNAMEQLRLSVEGIETQRVTARVLAQVLADASLLPDVKHTLRAVGYAEFLRVGVTKLEQTLPGFVRRSSANIATDITATELYDYERTLRFLDRQTPTCRGITAAGEYVLRSDGEEVYELAPTAPQQVQEYFSQPMQLPGQSDSGTSAQATAEED